MLTIRPVTYDDHKDLLALAKKAGIGMTSLPPDADVLAEKIDGAVKSFADTPKKPREHTFLFVLEDTETGAIVGSTGLKAHIGLTSPFYSYKLSTITQASRDLNIYSLQKVLHMVNDYTGATEIGSLFLLPKYRQNGLGSFLSRSRFLMIACFPELFDETVIAEIRGIHDEKGNSPFYDNLAHHFFQMPFRQADYIHATKGGQFISDLMPKYPIYVNLLIKKAQAVLGVPFKDSKPAVKLLENEGFFHAGYIDVFDGGPTLEVERARIRTVRESKEAKIIRLDKKLPEPERGSRYMICHTRLKDFSSCLGAIREDGKGGVAIAQDVAKALKVKPGDKIRYALG